MIRKLYIQKSIKKKFSSYITIVLIMITSMIVINIFSIYMDAVHYGDKLQFGEKPQIVLGQQGTSSVPTEQIILFNILTIIFAAIGAVAIYFAYVIFIEHRKRDLGILISLGMPKKQLKKMLFTELSVIYVPCFFIAVILSNIFMYLIITNLIYVEHDRWTMIAYKFSISSSLILLLLSFLSVITAFLISWKKISDMPIIQTIQNNFEDKNIKRNQDIWNKSSAVNYISNANLMRNKKIFIISSIISIPIICIGIVFSNYMNLTNTPSDTAAFWIMSETGVSAENIEELKNIDGIKNIESSEDFTFISVYIEDENDADFIRNELEDIFYGLRIEDNISAKQAGEKLMKGIITIAYFVCIVIFISMVVLLTLFTAFYVLNKKPQLTILKKIGATKTTLLKIISYEALTKGTLNAVIGIAVGTYISHRVIDMSAGYDFLINSYTFIFYGLIFTITIAAHFLPAFIAAEKIVTEKGKTENGNTQNIATIENI